MQNWYQKIIDFFKNIFEQKRLEEERKKAEEERRRAEEQKRLEEEEKIRRKRIEDQKKELKMRIEDELKFKSNEEYPTNNMENYPNNVLKPQVVEVQDNVYTLYKIRFGGISDLYNYLKSEPEINETVFRLSSLSSVTGDYNFAGVKYDTAVERLVDYNDPKYNEFLNLSKNSKVKNLRLGNVYESYNSVAGGIIRPEALATGDPHIYRSTKVYKVDKSVNIYATASYNSNTNKKQVYNKAVVLTNIIHALEAEGLIVNVDVFEISRRRDEILEIDLKIKNNGRNTNYQALYRSLCNVEFLRRILFRVAETSNVTQDWANNYGSSCQKEFVRELKHLKKNDYYFGTPQELGIKGRDIAVDFENAVKNLNMTDIIDVEKAKSRIKSSIQK